MKPVCEKCGSDDVGMEAPVVWENGEWIALCAYDGSAWCDQCREDNVTLKWVKEDDDGN